MIEDTPRGGDQYVSMPDWETVERSILLLNGLTRTYLCLYTGEQSNADDFLLVGGGEKGLYICTYYNGDEYSQVDASHKDDYAVIQVPVGQTSGKFRKHCTTLDQAIAATKYYYERATIESYPGWEEQ